MVTRSPFVDPVERTNLYAFVEATRRESVVELAVGPSRRLRRGAVCRDVPRTAGNIRLRRRRRPAVRHLRSEELQTKGFEAVPDRAIALGPRQPAARRAVEHVQVARGENAVSGRVFVVDESRQVRENAVR